MYGIGHLDLLCILLISLYVIAAGQFWLGESLRPLVEGLAVSPETHPFAANIRDAYGAWTQASTIVGDLSRQCSVTTPSCTNRPRNRVLSTDAFDKGRGIIQKGGVDLSTPVGLSCLSILYCWVYGMSPIYGHLCGSFQYPSRYTLGRGSNHIWTLKISKCGSVQTIYGHLKYPNADEERTTEEASREKCVHATTKYGLRSIMEEHQGTRTTKLGFKKRLRRQEWVPGSSASHRSPTAFKASSSSAHSSVSAWRLSRLSGFSHSSVNRCHRARWIAACR
jgi:hypothetical protein